MKDRIIMLIIGILIGAIIASAGFLIFGNKKKGNFDPSKDKGDFNPSSMGFNNVDFNNVDFNNVDFNNIPSRPDSK